MLYQFVWGVFYIQYDAMFVGLQGFQVSKLAVEQGRGHEVSISRLHALYDQIVVAMQMDEEYLRITFAQTITIATFECRTGEDNAHIRSGMMPQSLFECD
ncbi:hypothetical protein GCM10008066_07160 [Oxalicibacterium faecigallinarum]|uniref:Uncharacterized protein n=1 Tax=Oxalicibacterium faecigallinarum TaxID=573741 RepID=A0A8J3F165_9BURK|nr:hypothetical protein GCM10008066_07160 [Oxalicibacterium faecigallinarum]